MSKKRLVHIRKPRIALTKKGVRVSNPSARIGGLNVSKSGVSYTVRTKHGSYNTKRGCRTRLFVIAGVGLLVMLLIGAVAARAAPPAAATLPPGQDATVTRVVDGDTIEVKIAGKPYTVRYIGVDTPETVKPATPVQCFGKEASAYNKSLVNGKTVRLVKDVSESDRYGRLLRYVYLTDGRMVNELLLSGGYALVSTYPPDVRHVDRFLELQRAARDAGAGLWGKCSSPAATATPPQASQAPAGDAPCHCGAPDLDCKDFETQVEAQACWDYCGGQIDGPNPHRLDGKDNDGDVCESLP